MLGLGSERVRRVSPFSEGVVSFIFVSGPSSSMLRLGFNGYEK